MKPFSHYVRRTHLYLALLCLPWVVMYGISSVAFSHPDWFTTPEGFYDTSSDAWNRDGDWPCTVSVPEGDEVPRAVATELVRTAGLDVGAYGAYWSGERRVDVYIPDFWETRRLSYHLDEQRLYMYSRPSIPQNILTGMHARGGYQHDGFLNDAWAVMVDLVSIGFLLWVITGIYIWWQLPRLRGWGAVALIAGFLSFVAFFLTL